MVDEQPLIMLQRQIARRLPHMLFDRDMRDSLMLLTFSTSGRLNTRAASSRSGAICCCSAPSACSSSVKQAFIRPITSYLLIARSYISYNIL